jgi:hypothetical protein
MAQPRDDANAITSAEVAGVNDVAWPWSKWVFRRQLKPA